MINSQKIFLNTPAWSLLPSRKFQRRLGVFIRRHSLGIVDDSSWWVKSAQNVVHKSQLIVSGHQRPSEWRLHSFRHLALMKTPRQGWKLREVTNFKLVCLDIFSVNLSWSTEKITVSFCMQCLEILSVKILCQKQVMCVVLFHDGSAEVDANNPIVQRRSMERTVFQKSNLMAAAQITSSVTPTSGSAVNALS
jgi:hypothetical protein